MPATTATPEFITSRDPRTETRGDWDLDRVLELVAGRAGRTEAIFDLGVTGLGMEIAEMVGAERIVTRPSRPVAGSCDTQTGASALGLGRDERFDLVVLADVLHQVYSDKGRSRRGAVAIDHRAGLDGVRSLIATVAACVRPGGGVVITDDVLCEEVVPVVVRARNRAALEAVRTVADEYRAREIDVRFESDTTFVVTSRDLCVILSQYATLARGKAPAWKTERDRARQYMTASDYRRLLSHNGLVTKVIAGTPGRHRAAEERDFEILAGLPTFPARRIALLAGR